MRPRRRPPLGRCAALLLAACGVVPPAAAQLGLPALPRAPDLGGLPLRVDPPRRLLPQEAAAETPALQLALPRLARVEALLRTAPSRVARDPAGAPVLRGELLWLEPADAALSAARAAGFRVLREQALEPLGLRGWVLAPPRGLEPDEALRRLRTLDPDAAADYQHLFQPASGATAGALPAPATASAALPAAREGLRIGLVDGGVDAAHPALLGARVQRHGCGERMATVHGTAVAARLAAAGPRPRLYAADVYCDAGPAGGSTSDLLAALAWLAREQVPVINLSLVGPDNAALARALAALLRRGHIVVAAVGNDGPAAPPLYPAAYPGVVAVTGVDAALRVLPEAGRGAHVAFAAAGWVEPAGARGDALRGTSFAAPVVAARLARLHPAPEPAAAAAAVAMLAATARDLGAPGRDEVYGHGHVDAAGDASLAQR